MKCIPLVLFLFYQVSLQAQSVQENLVSQLNSFTEETPTEKIFIHTDRELYQPGDTVWFKAYLVDGVNHRFEAASRIIYVELFSEGDSLVHRLQLFADKGGAYSDIILNRELKPGTYYLRAYTNYMRNWSDEWYFKKMLYLWSPDSTLIDGRITNGDVNARQNNNNAVNKPVLGIYPEGGDLVAGIKSRIALKLKDQSLLKFEPMCQLVENGGSVVREVRFYERGLSTLDYTPVPGSPCELKLVIGDSVFSYELPRALREGYVLNINNRSSKLIVSVAKSGISNDKAYIVAHTRGKVFWTSKISFNGKNDYVVNLDTELIPSGVAHFTLFDDNGDARSERLCFIRGNFHRPELITNAKEYVTQQEAEFNIENLDSIQSLDCSVSVFNIEAGSIAENKGGIHTSLLLNSDLRGKIEDPLYFFDEQGGYKREYLLDLLMMTHGWRRFSWQDILKSPRRSELEYAPESGLMVTGWTSGLVNLNRPVQSRLIYTAMDENFYESEKVSDTDGRFSFGPFVSYDTINCIIQARLYREDKEDDKLDGKRNVMIHLDETTIPVFKSKQHVSKDYKFEITDDFLEEERIAAYKMDRYEDMMRVDMDELVVKAKKMTQRDSMDQIARKLSYYGEPSNRLIVDETEYQGLRSVFDLLRRIPGVRITGSPPAQSATIRGVASINASLTPLYLVNGMVTDEESVNLIEPYEVLFVDVLKDGRTAVFGSRGANGVIAIYTGYRESNTANDTRGILNFKLNGFKPARQFYSPDRSYEYRNQGLPDIRKTLWWDPDLRITKESESLRFICSDIKGKYKIVLNGISSDGTPVYSEAFFQVN